MKFLFKTTVVIQGIAVPYSIYLHTNGAYYAESMNPDYDNFLLQKIKGEWTTGLIRNQGSAEQIGATIDEPSTDI